MSKVTLITEKDSSDTFDFDEEELAKEVIGKVLEMENCPFDVEVSLSLVQDDEIQEMNRNFREIDRPTDVLSFPGLSYDTPSDFQSAASDAADCMDPETGSVVFGDIVINTKRVKEQAAEYGHSEKREFAFLVAHSTLHLCGYDHMTDPEAEEMFGRQEKALQALGITRD